MLIQDLIGLLRADNDFLEGVIKENNLGMEGSCSPDKRLFLMSLIHSCNAQLVYETGFNAGIMAAAMAKALEFTGGRYVGFEIRDQVAPAFNALVATTNCQMEIVWGDSIKTVPERVSTFLERPDIFFIDGGHSIEVLSADVRSALSCVRSGGYIVIDDAVVEPLKTKIIELLGKDRLIWIPGFHPQSSGMVMYQVH